MAVEVHVPAPFRRLTGNRAIVRARGGNVGELLDDLEARFPGFRGMLFDEQGRMPPHIKVYVNGQEIESLEGTNTPLHDGDKVTIIPLTAGGAAGPLSPAQRQRYARHLVLPNWGEEGQQKLASARVLVVGAGGLGSPALLYLAGAGVGTLGIVEYDEVELSNLPRQVLHHTHDVGRPKALSALESIKDLNPDVNVVIHATRLADDNATEIIEGYDIVLSAVDNLEARYATNDACVLLKKPMVEASVLAFEGQATVFLPGEGCYRCLYESPPPADVMPSPSEAGVFSILPAVMGSIQAAETLKLILGTGDTLSGRLLLFDGLAMEFREVRTKRNPKCPVCGDNPTIKRPAERDRSYDPAGTR